MTEYKPPEAKRASKSEPVYVATGSSRYRFADGTTILLMDGVSPQVTGEQLKELKRFKRVREVK